MWIFTATNEESEQYEWYVHVCTAFSA